MVRDSVLAELIGLKGLEATGTVFVGAGSSFSVFAAAGLNALGVTAGLKADALLSRFAPPAGLKGLKALVLGASAGWLAEPIFMKRIGLSECWGSTPSVSCPLSDISEPCDSESLRDVCDFPHFQQYFALFGSSVPHSEQTVRGMAHSLQNLASSESSRPQFIQNITCLQICFNRQNIEKHIFSNISNSIIHYQKAVVFAEEQTMRTN